MLLRKLFHVFILICFNIFMVSCEKKSSLTFVIDDTYSMAPVIHEAIRGANAIMDAILNKRSSQIENIILVTFNDPLVTLRTKTRNRNEFKASLQAIRVHGGGDCPEMSMSGLERALEESLPGSSIFVFTDASAKDYHKVERVKDLCHKKQSQVVFVLTGDCSRPNNIAYKVYYEIAAASSGQVFRLHRSNQISDILRYVEETAKGERTVLTSKVIPPHQLTDIPFTIDDQTEYAVISTSGQNVQLQVHGPTTAIEPIIWTNFAKIVKLNSPLPGKYVATVKGSSTTSVVVYGRTDFTFQHGFSSLKPKSLNDTAKQPISGEKSHLSISVTDPGQSVQIISIQILDMNDRIIKEVPLKKVSENFYMTEQDLWPETMFKIVVTGVGIKTKIPIKRMAKTPIEPQKPKLKPIINKVPVVTVSEGSTVSVVYGNALQLTCKVTAYPKPNIIWKDSKGTVMATKSSAVELPYKYISYLNVANVKTPEKYSCHADNNQGRGAVDVVIAIASPFTVTEYPKADTNVEFGKEATLKCRITSSQSMQVSWWYANSEKNERINTSDKYTVSSDGTELKIKGMDLNLAGKYSCVAHLQADPNIKTILQTNVKVVGVVTPQIDKQRTVINTKENVPVDIHCKILKGNPKPMLTWQYKSLSSDKPQTLAETGEVLRVNNVTLDNAGHYRCIAENIAGRDEQITEVIIEAPAKILLDNYDYESVVGDIVMRIPCRVVGYPKPTVSWSVNGKAISSDGTKYVIEDNVLIINKPKSEDSKKYTCKTVNEFGRDERTFDGIVVPDLPNLGEVHKVYILKGDSKKLECPIPHTDADYVRWYLNQQETNIIGSYVYLNKSTEYDDGNYTCRVSNKLGAWTNTLEVDVGYPPQFLYKPKKVVYWNGQEDLLNCAVREKPFSNIEWLLNGEVIKGANKPELDIINFGHYTCRARNVHGAVERSFDVTSNECLINRSWKTAGNTPLMLTESLFQNDEETDQLTEQQLEQQIQQQTTLNKLSLTWADLETEQRYLVVQKQKMLRLFCRNSPKSRNSFKNFPEKSEIIAICDHEDKFLVNGKVYKYSELQCNEQVTPIIKKTGHKCLSNNSETIKIGYDLNDFLNVFEVCFDVKEKVPLYARVIMSENNIMADVPKIKWNKYTEIAVDKPEEAYQCKKDSKHCYTKTQLVNAQDVAFGPAQTATFIDYLNAIPVWKNENKSWLHMEKYIRDELHDRQQMEMTVWSGASHFTKKEGHTVPRYLWKVMDNFAVVYVNDPTPVASDRLCTGECDQMFTVQHDIRWPIYCCSLTDFKNAFHIPDDTFKKSRI